MQYYVWHNNESPTKASIRALCLKGYEEGTPAEELAKAILVEGYPDPPHREGKVATSYINPQTKEYIYEYTNAPDMEPQKAEELGAEIGKLKGDIDKLKKELVEAQLALVETYETIGGLHG